MTVKLLGAGNVSEEAIGILGDAADAVEFAEVDELDLLEFLAADLDPVPADPTFQRELGELLWDMVLDGRVSRPPRH